VIEAQLLQARKMGSIGTLAGGIAHDFNNILSGIMGYTELALDSVERESLLYNNLQEVFRAGKRARDLVKQILTFSRQTGQDRKPIQVKHIVNEALKFLRASLPTSTEVRRNIQSDALVLADPTQIHQVLMNLCTNADHAMREKGGVLEVKLEEVELDTDFTALQPDMKPGAYLNLTVSDTRNCRKLWRCDNGLQRTGTRFHLQSLSANH
jgi:signal transduction histidine kinase